MIRFLQTQGRLQKYLLAGILVFVSFMMVMYLVPGFLDAFGSSSSDPNIAAKVGSTDVTIQEVNRVAQNMVRRQFPKGAPPQLVSLFQDQAMQQLIVQKVFLSEAHRLGLDATDEELRNELLHGQFADQLTKDGQFVGRQQYEGWVQANTGETVPRFEELVKQSITVQKLISVIQGGATVTPESVKSAYFKVNTKVKVDYAYISTDQVEKSISASDAELKAYYEKNKAQLKDAIPEQRKARYIIIDGANLASAKVTDADLQKYYNDHKEEFRVGSTATVRHILFAPEKKGGDQKALDLANEVKKQLASGGDWKALAKKYSDDPGSADKGGEYVFTADAGLAPEFKQATFNGKVGELQGPVKTQFGYHIIQVEKREEAHLKTLDEVKAQIAPIVARQKSAQEAANLANTVQGQARTESLDKAAASHNLQVVSTDWFSRNAALPGIGNSPAFADAVFAGKTPSAPVSVQIPQGYAVVQAVDTQAPRTPTFEEVKPQLEANFKRERAQGMMQQKGQELADKAHQLHNLKEAAKQVGAEFKTSELVMPSQQLPEIGALDNLVDSSTMKVGEISNAVPAGRNIAVISIVEKQAPSEEEFAKAKDEFRNQMLDQKRNELLQVYVSTLKDKMQKDGKIKIYDKNLQRAAKDTQE